MTKWLNIFYVMSAQAVLQVCLAMIIMRVQKPNGVGDNNYCEVLAMSGIIAAPALFAGAVVIEAIVFQAPFILGVILTISFSALGLPASLCSFLMKMRLEQKADDCADFGHPRMEALASIIVPICVTGVLVYMFPVLE